MRSFIGELKRRNVIRVAVAYGAVSWLLLQVFGLVMPAFDIPASALRMLVLAVVLGFPVALAFSWAYELTPDGFRRETDIAPGTSIAQATGRRLDLIIVGLLLLLVGLLLLDRFVLSRHSAVPQTQVASLPATNLQPEATASIAVLPFTDMSQAGDQGYFSDGLSEELLDLLAQVPGLHVAGRTSSFSFRDKDATIADIGKALHVSSVLEGSVRKSGDRLRITAQLISVADGYHVWSKTYDRELTDVFAVQDEIAGAVVDALKLKLLRGQRPSTARHHVPGFETFDQYLRGRQLLVHSGRDGHVRAIAAFKQAIALDPAYAEAYSGLAMAESFVVEADPDAGVRAAGQQRAMAAAERAVALDPQLGDAYAARGYLRGTFDWDWNGALADVARSIALDPGDAKNQLRYGYLLATLGRLPDAKVALEKSTERDPLFTPAWYWLGRIMAAQGDYAGARLALERALAVDPSDSSSGAAAYLATVSLLQGDAAGARHRFATLDNAFGLAVSEHDLGHALQSQQALDHLIAEHSLDDAYRIAAAFAWRGDRDQAFAWLDRAIEQHDSGLVLVGYDPMLRSLRSDPRYRPLLRKLGLPG